MNMTINENKMKTAMLTATGTSTFQGSPGWSSGGQVTRERGALAASKLTSEQANRLV